MWQCTKPLSVKSNLWSQFVSKFRAALFSVRYMPPLCWIGVISMCVLSVLLYCLRVMCTCCKQSKTQWPAVFVCACKWLHSVGWWRHIRVHSFVSTCAQWICLRVRMYTLMRIRMCAVCVCLLLSFYSLFRQIQTRCHASTRMAHVSRVLQCITVCAM